MNKEAVLEGLLFVVGDEGITLDNICEILEINKKEAQDLLKKLREEYNKINRGLRITFMGESFKLTTKQEHKEYYQKLITTRGTNTLSSSALETLAIIAYNPKITRAEIESIRGVNSDGTIYKLLEYNLIESVGKLDAPGRPTMYSTTSNFLKLFDLESLEELPDLPRYKVDENEQIVIDDIVKGEEK